MNMFMMNITIVIYVQTIKYWNKLQLIVMDIENIKVINVIVRNCLHIKEWTKSKQHVKSVTRHIWEGYIEQVEDIRYTVGMKEIYKLWSETIERGFADVKEKHGMRYTQYRGLAKVKMEFNLLFAWMKLKNLANWLDHKGLLPAYISHILSNIQKSFFENNFLGNKRAKCSCI